MNQKVVTQNFIIKLTGNKYFSMYQELWTHSQVGKNKENEHEVKSRQIAGLCGSSGGVDAEKCVRSFQNQASTVA